jgi:phospholipase/carboxylesterase
LDLVHAVYEPEGDGPFPTLYALHGWGSNALDLMGLAPHLVGGSLLVIAPGGPLRVPLGEGVYGSGWFPISAGGPVDHRGFLAARAAVEEFLEAAGKRYPVDPSRTLMLGFSQGGLMAYDLALREPERYAGLVALSAWLPEELAETYAYRPAHSLLPTLVQHGRDDPMIPVARAEGSVRRLRTLGLPVTYSDYSMGHSVSPESLRDLNRWLQGDALQGPRESD